MAHWLALELMLLVLLRVPKGVTDALVLGDTVLLLLWKVLPVREPEVHADSVPRMPSASTPPVALTLPVPHPLYDI